jgi:preprotein translocase subunit SecF
MRWPLIRYIPRSTHFRFVRWAPVAAVFSAVLILASIGLLIFQGLNLGIDFKGGVALEIAMPRPVPQGEMRAALDQIGAHDGQVQGFGSPNAALVKFRPAKDEKASDASKHVEAELVKRFPDLKVTSRSEVGAKVSGELLLSGFKALGVALLLTLAYIWFRFGLSYGTGAVVAVIHDIVLTLGLLSICGIEFSMTEIAALLTVIGYSMNEKVITFDRLKENLRKYRTTPLRDVIDLSENERLSRTVITGTTALLALGGTMAFGGPVLYPLVFTMIFGIIIGTYSSVYIALPMILIWGVKRNDEEATPVKFGAASRP